MFSVTKRLSHATIIHFCEISMDATIRPIVSLSLLTDNPEKDDNGENDVVQEATKRVHAGLTAVMLAEKLRPILSAILSQNNRLKTAYRRAISVTARAKLTRVRAPSLRISPWPPLSLPSFLSSVCNSPIWSTSIRLARARY